MCRHVYGGQRPSVFFSRSPHFRDKFSHGHCSLPIWPGQQAPGICASLPPQHWGDGNGPPHLAFYVGAEAQIQTHACSANTFYQWNRLLCPVLYFLSNMLDCVCPIACLWFFLWKDIWVASSLGVTVKRVAMNTPMQGFYKL